MLTTFPTAAIVFLPFVLAIAIWVAWSDMKFMKIPNKAVLALAGVYVIVGLILVALSVIPLVTWAWGLALLAIVLVIGILANMISAIGAGDAKYAAAMAPYFVGGDIRFILALFAACLLGAFAVHRIMRAIPAFRRATPDWKSWTDRKFPMGLALSGTLVFYISAAILLH